MLSRKTDLSSYKTYLNCPPGRLLAMTLGHLVQGIGTPPSPPYISTAVILIQKTLKDLTVVDRRSGHLIAANQFMFHFGSGSPPLPSCLKRGCQSNKPACIIIILDPFGRKILLVESYCRPSRNTAKKNLHEKGLIFRGILNQ